MFAIHCKWLHIAPIFCQIFPILLFEHYDLVRIELILVVSGCPYDCYGASWKIVLFVTCYWIECFLVSIVVVISVVISEIVSDETILSDFSYSTSSFGFSVVGSITTNFLILLLLLAYILNQWHGLLMHTIQYCKFGLTYLSINLQ